MASAKNRKGDRALERLKEGLKRMPLSVAHDVAKAASPALTTQTRQAFASGRTVYGDPRPRSQRRIEGAGPVQGPLQMIDKDSGGRAKYQRAARKRAKRPEYLTAPGKPLTLVDTGTTRDDLAFESLGTVVRVVLAQPYQKYLIGKYRILPMGKLPVAWDANLDQIAQTKLAQYTREVIG